MRYIIIVSFLFFTGCTKPVYDLYQSYSKRNVVEKEIYINLPEGNFKLSYMKTNSTKKPTIVFLHGFASRKETWIRVVNYLKDEKIFVPDFIGSGKSDKPFSINYTIKKNVEVLHKFLNKLNIKNPVLVGSSLGGAIALEYAYIYPNNVEKLILIDPFGIYAKKSEFDKLPLKKKKEIWINLCSAKKVKELIYYINHNPPYVPDIFLDYLAKNTLCKETNITIHKAKGFLREKDLKPLDDFKSIVTKIKTPTLIIWGDKDRILHLENGKLLNSLMPNSKLKIFENTGHMPVHEVPLRTAKEIKNFIKSTK